MSVPELWGVLDYDGRPVYYEMHGEAVRARYVGEANWVKGTAELLAAIERDVEHHTAKCERGAEDADSG